MSKSTSTEQIFSQTIDMPGWLEQRPLTFPTLAGYERAARIFQPETKKYSTKKTTERERERELEND